jgi:2-methylcitrate dehydratase PrpD
MSVISGTERVVEFVRRTTWADLPAPVQHQARRCLLDLMGALTAGTGAPVAELMARIGEEQFGGDAATILCGGRRASAVGAALANGFAANALDIDDGYRSIKGHPGVCVLPPLLAASEYRAGVSGREFLTALVIGYEVAIRAGLIRHATSTTYHSSGSWGAIAGAAVAGRLLGLNDVQLTEALGSAEYHAPIAPMMKGIDTPCMGKDSTGWGAMVGMASALMAQGGFSGVRPLFDDATDAQWIAGLGHTYEIANLYFKPYACCRWAQPAIAGALQLIGRFHVEPSRIERIVVRTFDAATRLSRQPPRHTEEAQYNLSYPVAAALVDGEVGPRQVLPPRIYDARLLTLADRVEAVVSPRHEAAFPAAALADVEIVTRDGESYVAENVEAPWQPPAAPPTDGELEAKFRWLARPVLGAERTDALVEMIWHLEQIDDVHALIGLCTPGRDG